MKKITFLVLSLLMTTLTFGQSALITGYVDSPCSGAAGRVLEIYVNGTVDFTDWSLGRQANGGGYDQNSDLSSLGTLTDEFAYITNDAAILDSEFGITTNVIETSFITDNGNDGFQIVNNNDAVIDRFGADGVDGSGTAWEHTDSYYYRNDGEIANAGNFDPTNWTFGDLNVLNDQGNCNGGAPLTDFITLGSFMTTPSQDPEITIITPSSNQQFLSSTPSITVTFDVANFSISSSATAGDGDGYVQYSIDDGNTYNDLFSAEAFDLNSLSPGDYTLDMRLVDNSGDPLTPAIVDMVDFSIINSTEIADIATLRSSAEDETYTLTGEALLTYQQSFRSQKYIEDGTAAILIDDPDGVINTSYSIGDGITGITGTLSIFTGIVQFVPITDPGAASSTDNQIVPQQVTPADLANSPEDYASEFVILDNLSVDNPPNPVWETGTIYDISNSDGDYSLYTSFYGADYIGEDIPTTPMNTAGIITRNDSDNNGVAEYYFTPRKLSDFGFELSVGQNRKAAFTLYPNPVSGQNLTIETAQQGKTQVVVYNMFGQQVVSQELKGSTINVSSLTSGIYLVKIAQNGQSATKKIVVE